MLYSSVEVHDISEEHTASILMVKKYAKPKKKEQVGSEQQAEWATWEPSSNTGLKRSQEGTNETKDKCN